VDVAMLIFQPACQEAIQVTSFDIRVSELVIPVEGVGRDLVWTWNSLNFIGVPTLVLSYDRMTRLQAAAPEI
jgi:hypothetical protein